MMRQAIVLPLMLILVAGGIAAAQKPEGGQQGARPRQPTHADVKYGPYARNVMDVWVSSCPWSC